MKNIVITGGFGFIGKKLTDHFLKNNIREIFYPSVNKTPLGRWGIKEQQQKVDLSIMYANEDHCGLCNDYAANINKNKNNKV